jgi:hypothetical protein
MNPTSTIEPTRINYQIKNYNRNLQANSVSHHRRPDEEREQRERGARAGGREGGRSLYARRHGARWPGRRVSAGPWPACTAGTGSWRRRRRWSRACGRPRPGAAPRPSSSSAPSPPQARSRESIQRGEGGFACVCNLFPLFFLPHLRPPLFVFVTARTWASPICQRNADRRLPSISFNPAGQRLTPHGGERSPLPFLSSSARSLSHASSPVGQSLLLLPLPLRERAWWLPQGQLAAAGGLESFNQQTRKNNTDQQRDETEPYQEMVQRFRTTCRNCNPSKRTLLF